MKLKYDIKDDENGLTISLKHSTVRLDKRTTDHIKENKNSRHFLYDWDNVVQAGINELHWKFTKKNLEAVEFQRNVCFKLQDAYYAKDIDSKNQYILDAVERIRNYFDGDRNLY
jgi:hypothetical protein